MTARVVSAVAAVAALVGVCVLSRWCSQLQDDVDRLRRRA